MDDLLAPEVAALLKPLPPPNAITPTLDDDDELAATAAAKHARDAIFFVQFNDVFFEVSILQIDGISKEGL